MITPLKGGFLLGGWIKTLANHPASSLELIEVQCGPYSCCYIPVIVSETFNSMSIYIYIYVSFASTPKPKYNEIYHGWRSYISSGLSQHVILGLLSGGSYTSALLQTQLKPQFKSGELHQLAVPKIVKIGYDEYHFHHQKWAESSILQQDHPIMNMSFHAVK